MDKNIIDLHVHIFPEKVSEKARKNLEQRHGMRFISDPDLDSLKRYMDLNDIATAVIQPVAISTIQAKSINDWLLGLVSKDESIKAFGACYPDGKDMGESLKKFKQCGINGIKLHPDYQHFYPDDNTLFDLYEHIIMNDMWVLFHAGLGSGNSNRIYSSTVRFLNLRKKYPELKIILAHLGGYRNWSASKKELIGKDFYMDLSYTFGILEDHKIKEMIRLHGPNKIVFGSDFPLYRSRDNLKMFLNLDLDDKDRKDILYNNAKKDILL